MTSQSAGAFPWDALVCPLCKGTLVFHPERIECAGCASIFPQPQAGWIDLLPSHLRAGQEREVVDEADVDWSRRQEECDAWYAGLLTDPTDASHCFQHDYSPHAPFLGELTGDVLDVGGGNGLVRHFMPRVDRYVDAEPSTAWLETDWSVLADQFPCLATLPIFVRSVGEHLPFADRRFDAVLSFWSLNHVIDPATVVWEMTRVLKRDGKLLVVLEEMPPRWRDLVGPIRRSRGAGVALKLAVSKLKHAVTATDWPLQSDHIQIREADLERWAQNDLVRVRRAWVGQYLTYEFRRR